MFWCKYYYLFDINFLFHKTHTNHIHTNKIYQINLFTYSLYLDIYCEKIAFQFP